MTIISDEPATTARTPIQEFYAEQNIFITGGTGFLGKVLVEKLLRSCTELSSIYLLVRPKKGKDIHTRLDDIFEDPLFEKIRTEQPKYRHKIFSVAGDCSLPNLGLSEEDKELLLSKISIVFHVAATVRFDEKIKYAVAINVSGTKEILDLSRSMNNLKSIIYVSTAYSNCNRLTIDEKFYPAPVSAEGIEKVTECLDEDKLNKITPTLLGDYPNTYAFTKAIAESTAKENGKDLPLGIFRPAMVISTAYEPIKGWIDNIYGPTGAVVGGGAGLLRTLNVNINGIAELVPADLTVNALIASAWDVATNKNVAAQPPIYNYVASWKNSEITWKRYANLSRKFGTETPSIRAVWCYVNYVTKYNFLYNTLKIILHIIPALILDAGLLVTGQKPKVLKIYKKIHKFAEVTSFFTLTSWTFHNDNTRALWDKLGSEDQKTFFFSMADFDWESYMRDYISGLRFYIFKDDPSTIPAARKRMAIMEVFHKIIVYTCLAFLLWCSYKLLSTVTSFGQAAQIYSENIATVQ